MEWQSLGLSIFLSPVAINSPCKECSCSLGHAEQPSEPSHNCIAFLPVSLMNTSEAPQWKLPAWEWTEVDAGAEDTQARRTSAHHIPPRALLSSCPPTSAAMSWICQPAAALKWAIVLPPAAVVAGIVQLLQLVGHKVQPPYPCCNEIWQLLFSGRQSMILRKLLC